MNFEIIMALFVCHWDHNNTIDSFNCHITLLLINQKFIMYLTITSPTIATITIITMALIMFAR